MDDKEGKINMDQYTIVLKRVPGGWSLCYVAAKKDHGSYQVAMPNTTTLAGAMEAAYNEMMKLEKK
jgi:hypothetical protein